MARGGTARDGCIQRCEGQKKQKRSSVYRFFKFVLGEIHSKFMYLPPAFARRMKHLTDKETQIEDSNGKRWPVTLSCINSSLAFHEGWQKFFLDHGLEVGFTLFFKYTMGSHFIVHIFGKSACERINFDDEISHRSKRRRRHKGIASQDEFNLPAGENSRDNPISASVHEFIIGVEHVNPGVPERPPVSGSIDVPINRKDGHRNPVNDLSGCEMENGTSDANKASGRQSHIDIDLPKARELLQELQQIIGLPRTDTAQHDANLENASGTNISRSCNRVFELGNPAASDATEQTKTTAREAEVAVMETCLINSRSGDISLDKLEKASNAKISPTDDTLMTTHSHQAGDHSRDAYTSNFDEKRSVDSKMMDMLDNQDGKRESFSVFPSTGSVKIAEREHVVENKSGECSNSSSAVKNSLGNEPVVVGNHSDIAVLELTSPAGDDAKEEIKTIVDDAEMAAIEKALDGKTSLCHTGITDQIRKPVDDTRMSACSHEGGDYSCENRKMKVILDNFCNFQDVISVPLGKSESFGVSPSIGISKISESEIAVKSKVGEFPISSSTVKKPLGPHNIKKEAGIEGNMNISRHVSHSGLHHIKKEIEMDDNVRISHQVIRSGKGPAVAWNCAQMNPSIVKVEPDLSCDIINPLSTVPFSAEVKTQLYLELPVAIPSTRARQRSQMIVYLRDSTRRLYPVVYREYLGGRAFTFNWTKYCKVNNIKPGDKCRFQIEDSTSCILRVDVARRSD